MRYYIKAFVGCEKMDARSTFYRISGMEIRLNVVVGIKVVSAVVFFYIKLCNDSPQ